MAINTYRFWMATDANRLLANQTSFIAASSPIFYQGNEANLELHIVASAGVGNTPVELPFPAGAAITVAVGETNAYPTGGTWQLMVNGMETDDMPYNATDTIVQTALNELPAVLAAGGVSVSKVGDAYNITWNTYGSKPLIEQGSDALTPASYITATLVQAGTEELKEIIFVELRQNPIALSNTWTALPSPVISNQIIKAWDGSTKIYRVNIDPQPKSGSFNIFYNNLSYTFRYNVSADEIANALNLQVFNTGFSQWDIVLTTNTTLETSGTLIGYSGYYGSINLSTAECHQFLNGEARKATTIEVSISVDDKKYTLLQTSCVIASDVITDGAILPLPLGTPISNDQANARFVRRDADQNPSNTTVNQIWKNLGTTTLNGVNIATALSSSHSPGPGNAFATMTDLGSVHASWGNITGTLSNQSDLTSELNNKLPLSGGTLYSGSNYIGIIPQNSQIYFDNGGAVTTLTDTQLNFQDGTSSYRADGASVTGNIELPGETVNIIIEAGNGISVYRILEGIQTGVTISPDWLRFPDNTLQTTAALPLTGGTMADNAIITNNDTNNGGYSALSGGGLYCETTEDNGVRHSSFINNLNIGSENITTQKSLYFNYDGIHYPDNSVQVTAGLPLTGGKMSGAINLDTRGPGDDGPWSQAFIGGFGATDSLNGHNTFFDTEGLYVNGANGKSVTISNTEVTSINLPITFSKKVGEIGVDGYRKSTFTQNENGFDLKTDALIGIDGYVNQLTLDHNGLKINSSQVLDENFLQAPTVSGKLVINIPVGNNIAPLRMSAGKTPASTSPGDIWISTSSMKYKDSSNTERIIADTNRVNVFTAYQTIQQSTSNPTLTINNSGSGASLKITNTGTGESLRVEDETSPDTTPFVISNSGRVGIGVAPDASAALSVDSAGVKFSDASIQITKGDRYKATSTTSMVIDGANSKVFQTQTNLAYTKFQNCTIYPTAGTTQVMYCVVNSYNATTGALDVDSVTHTGSGTFSDWVINVG